MRSGWIWLCNLRDFATSGQKNRIRHQPITATQHNFEQSIVNPKYHSRSIHVNPRLIKSSKYLFSPILSLKQSRPIKTNPELNWTTTNLCNLGKSKSIYQDFRRMDWSLSRTVEVSFKRGQKLSVGGFFPPSPPAVLAPKNHSVRAGFETFGNILCLSYKQMATTVPQGSQESFLSLGCYKVNVNKLLLHDLLS